ncbi:hypothetical protein PanWU01x14_011960, partial [Parasponia andersonii]
PAPCARPACVPSARQWRATRLHIIARRLKRPPPHHPILALLLRVSSPSYGDDNRYADGSGFSVITTNF